MLGSPLHIGSAACNPALALARCQSQDKSSISTLKVLVKQRVDLVEPELWVSLNEVLALALGMSKRSHVLFSRVAMRRRVCKSTRTGIEAETQTESTEQQMNRRGWVLGKSMPSSTACRCVGGGLVCVVSGELTVGSGRP